MFSIFRKGDPAIGGMKPKNTKMETNVGSEQVFCLPQFLSFLLMLIENDNGLDLVLLPAASDEAEPHILLDVDVREEV